MGHSARVYECVVLEWIYGEELVEDDFVALRWVAQANIDSVGTVVDVQFESLVTFVVIDREWGEQLRVFVFELKLLQVHGVVFAESTLQSHVDLLHVLLGDGVGCGVLVQAVHTLLLAGTDSLQILVLLVEVVVDEGRGRQDEDTLLDVLPEMDGHERDEVGDLAIRRVHSWWM